MSTFFPHGRPFSFKKWIVFLSDGRKITVLAKSLRAAKEAAVQNYNMALLSNHKKSLLTNKV